MEKGRAGVFALLLENREMSGAMLHPLTPESLSACPFCAVPPGAILLDNELAFVIDDRYPVTPGHVLVIPKRHVADCFDLTRAEREACDDLLHRARNALLAGDPEVSGFNVGVNAGQSAGQTIFHCHIHLIPRRDGDTQNPRGGVRGVIPGRQQY